MSTIDLKKAASPQRPSRRQFVQYTTLGAVTLGSGLLTACGGGGGSEVPATELLLQRGPKTGAVSTPTLGCGSSTQASITISVTAGVTGAPAGFSLQWMTAAEYLANSEAWYLSDDPRLCKASFSGNANLSRYELAQGESVEVTVGEFLFDNGASTNCSGALVCGTEYVFRAFAHATSALQRSSFTENLRCTTLACGSGTTCTHGQGYWKTHGPVPTGNNSNEWPVTALTLGSVLYTDLQLLAIFNKPAGGNGLIALAHQLIAAKLNIANGAASSAIDASVADADTLIGGLVVPPVGGGSLAPSATSALTVALLNYNEGATGPGQCD